MRLDVRRPTWGCFLAIAACGGRVGQRTVADAPSLEAGAVGEPSGSSGSSGPGRPVETLPVPGGDLDGGVEDAARVDVAPEATTSKVDATFEAAAPDSRAPSGGDDATDDSQAEDGDSASWDASTSDEQAPACPDEINVHNLDGECVITDYGGGWNAWAYVPTADFALSHIAVADCNVLSDGGEDEIDVLDSITGDSGALIPGPVLATGWLDGSGDVIAWAALDSPVPLVTGHTYFVATTASTGTGTGNPVSTMYTGVSVSGPWLGPFSYPWTAYLCE
jgi:hypothetical protein